MVTIEPPRERQCERCGRVETWDDDIGAWVGAGGDADQGDPHCVHEWDITGSYNPLGNTT